MIITSKDNKRIKNIKKMKNTGTSSCFLINGKNNVDIAIKMGLVLEIYSLYEYDFKETYIVNKEIMDIISFHSGNDIVGVCKLNTPKKLKGNAIYLDEISDPYNLGIIIKLAKLYNYKDIILSNKCVNPFNYKCLDECGSDIFDISLHFNGNEIIKELKNEYKIISTGLKSSKTLNSILPIKDKHIIVFGNEAHGISSYIFDLSSDIIRIDIKNIESLNVACCAGIVLKELSKEG